MDYDACYTNHVRADQNDIENLTILPATAGCIYIIGIPHGDDVTLNYQTTGFREAVTIRETLDLCPAKEFEKRMERVDLTESGKLTSRTGNVSVSIK